MLYSSNSSTAIKSRQQPTQEDITFASIVSRMKSDAEYFPDEKELSATGKWQKVIKDLVDAKKQDGTPGFTSALDATSILMPRIDILLDYIESQDQEATEQEDQDVRTRTGKNGKRVFIRLTEDDVDQFPDLEFLISNILPTDAVSLLYAISGAGKTFNALHFAQCVARGIPWFGRSAKQGNVLYVYAEGKLGLKPRLQAWRKHHEAEKTGNVTYIGVPVQLKSDRQTLFDTIEDMIANGEKPKFMIIDTFSNCASGINQNQQDEVEPVLKICHEIKDRYGVHVMLVHHTNKSGDFNGTMAFRNHVDTMIELVPDEKVPGVLWMKCEKQRDGAEKFSDIKLSLKPVELGLNVETMESLSSCVVVTSDTLTSKEAQAETEAIEKENMLTVLSLYGELSTAQWKKHSLTYEVSSRSFDRHSKTLAAEGKVKQRTKGKNGTAIYWSLPQAENVAQEKQQPLTPLTTINSEVV